METSSVGSGEDPFKTDKLGTRVPSIVLAFLKAVLTEPDTHMDGPEVVLLALLILKCSSSS